MTDIVQKLRDWRGMTPVACSEAANEIEKLRKALVVATDKIADMDRLLEELSEVDEPPKAAEQPGR